MLKKDFSTASAALPKADLNRFLKPFEDSSLCEQISVEFEIEHETAQVKLQAKDGYGFLLEYALQSGPLKPWGHHFTVRPQQ